jgi:hypothetical protein
MALEELRLAEDHIDQLDQRMAPLLTHRHAAVQRLADVPGLSIDSAQQIIAEVGITAATFPSPKHLASWMVPARAMRTVPARTIATVAPKATARCGASAIRPPTPPRRPRAPSRNRVSPSRSAHLTRASHRRDRPPALPFDLEAASPWDSARRTRSGRHERGEASAGTQKDP